MKKVLYDHNKLDELGLLDEGQPTESSHRDYIKNMCSNFSPEERRLIRYNLGLDGSLGIAPKNKTMKEEISMILKNMDFTSRLKFLFTGKLDEK